MSMPEMEKLASVRKKMGVEKEKGKGKEVLVQETNGKEAMAGAGKERMVYPAPLYSHEEVVRDPAIFLVTLEYFHFTMGTEFMIPVIGGKELDLRLLYVEVTQRGGVEQVIGEKRWREVVATFKFPRTATNASVVLRKHYLALLHHFEQVYFFRNQGPLVPPPAPLQTKAPLSKPDLSLKISDSTKRTPQKRKRAHPTSQNHGPYNVTFTGTIHTKFEYGYIATVKIGSETMCAVLFNVKHLKKGAPSSLAVEAPSCATASQAASTRKRNRQTASQAASTRKRYKQKWGQKHHDLVHPKQNRSAYNFFYTEKYYKLRALFPHQVSEHSKLIRELWDKLSEEERSVYKDWELKDKKRYKKEMQEYEERLKLVQPKEVVMAAETSTANTEVVAAK